jgi:hypothetical protein
MNNTLSRKREARRERDQNDWPVLFGWLNYLEGVLSIEPHIEECLVTPRYYMHDNRSGLLTGL